MSKGATKAGGWAAVPASILLVLALLAGCGGGTEAPGAALTQPAGQNALDRLVAAAKAEKAHTVIGPANNLCNYSAVTSTFKAISDTGQLLGLRPPIYCYPAREQDLSACSVVPPDILNRLPAVDGALFPSRAQLVGARELVRAGWDRVVGANLTGP